MSSLFSGLDAFGKETSILNQFLFPAPKTSYSWASFPGELVCVVGREGNTVPCTLMPGVKTAQQKGTGQQYEYREQPATCLVIYCHANGEDLGVLNEAGHWLCDTLGVHMLIPEYPGYGMAPGSPHEASVIRNIVTAYDFAVNALHWDPKNIMLFGRSIGTGPAIKLSAELDCGGLILVSPYTSVKDMVRTHAGVVTSWLTAELTKMFPSEETIRDVKCPTLIVHGANDLVIPSDQARRLHSAAAAEQKRLILLEGIGHHGIDLHFAVAHECPRFFNLDGFPKVMNLDQFLCDPSLQGDTVASPVPAFDLRNMSWSRPSLPLGSIPYLRDPAASSAPLVDMSSYWSFESQGHKQVITDEVLLSRLQKEGLEEEQGFFQQEQKSRRDKEKANGGARQSWDNNGVTEVPATSLSGGHGSEIHRRLGAEGNGIGGKEASPPLPPPKAEGEKLFVY